MREGTFLFDPSGDLNQVYALPADDSIYHFTYPVAQYDHDEGLAIAGGFEYRSSKIPLLKGEFLFGDIPSGRLFYIDVAEIRLGSLATIQEWSISIDGKTARLKDVCGADRFDLRFGQDSSGELYLLTKADGKVYKVSGATRKP